MRGLADEIESLFSDNRFDGRFYGFQMVDEFLRLCGRDPHKAADRWLAAHEPKVDQIERNRERNRVANMSVEQVTRKRQRERDRRANMTPEQIDRRRTRRRELRAIKVAA